MNENVESFLEVSYNKFMILLRDARGGSVASPYSPSIPFSTPFLSSSEDDMELMCIGFASQFWFQERQISHCLSQFESTHTLSL